MNNWQNIGNIITGLIIGISSGFLYFGLLWITLQKGLKSRSPYFIMILSYFIRLMIMALIIFFALKYLGLAPAIFFLIGVTVARLLISNQVTKRNFDEYQSG